MTRALYFYTSMYIWNTQTKVNIRKKIKIYLVILTSSSCSFVTLIRTTGLQHTFTFTGSSISESSGVRDISPWDQCWIVAENDEGVAQVPKKFSTAVGIAFSKVGFGHSKLSNWIQCQNRIDEALSCEGTSFLRTITKFGLRKIMQDTSLTIRETTTVGVRDSLKLKIHVKHIYMLKLQTFNEFFYKIVGGGIFIT